MKLLRLEHNNEIKLCLLDNNNNFRIIQNFNNLSPKNLSKNLLDEISEIDISKLEIAPKNSKILPCIDNVGKIICIGLNYADHAEEAGMQVPSQPMIFSKAITSIIGPFDDVHLPPNSKKSDWEVEIAIVILKEAKNINVKDSDNYIAGYTIVNDISERYFQIECEGQFVKGKSYDTFCPLGPYLVTKDEIADVTNLNMSLKVNGEIMQNSNTKQMVYKPNEIVSYLSKFMTLMPGDIIPTGTPPGVGMGQKPQKFLKAGDVMELEIENLGKQKQKVF